MIRIRCPSCAGPLTFQCRASLYAVCPYCRSLVLRKDMDVEKVGEAAELAEDSSPIQLGTRGRYRNRQWQAIGRLQLRYPAGLWNEWHIDFSSGTSGWLGETQGLYAVTFAVFPRETMPRPEELEAGRPVLINGERFQVKDIEKAECVSGEGELPFSFEGGYSAPSADLAGDERKFATLDYSEQPPLVFVGENCEVGELELENLRRFEGW